MSRDLTVRRAAQMNPFLHLSLHLAIEEQLSIDQPPGIRASFEALAEKRGEHDAKHARARMPGGDDLAGAAAGRRAGSGGLPGMYRS